MEWSEGESSLKMGWQVPCPWGEATAEAKETPMPLVAQRSPLYSSTSIPRLTECHSRIPSLTLPVFMPLAVTGCDRNKPSSPLWAKLVPAHNYSHNCCSPWINKSGNLIQTSPAACSLIPPTRTKEDSWFCPMISWIIFLAGNKVFKWN